MNICTLTNGNPDYDLPIFWIPGKPLYTKESDGTKTVIEDTEDCIPNNIEEAREICLSFCGCTGWYIKD